MPPGISGGFVTRTLKIPKSKDAQVPVWALLKSLHGPTVTRDVKSTDMVGQLYLIFASQMKIQVQRVK